MTIAILKDGKIEKEFDDIYDVRDYLDEINSQIEDKYEKIKLFEVDVDHFIEAVEQNNDLNQGRWLDWDNADHIIETYTSLENGLYAVNKDDLQDIKEKLNELIEEDVAEQKLTAQKKNKFKL